MKIAIATVIVFSRNIGHVLRKTKRSLNNSRHKRKSISCCFIVLFSLFAFPSGAWAYRPFVSTDAAVSDPKKTELELGFFNFSHAEEDTVNAPSLRLNYGFAKDWEVVAESELQVYKEGPERNTELKNSALSLKFVEREGILQNREGPSLAGEFGVLLPSTLEGQKHTGLEFMQILSGKIEEFVYHVNAGIEFDRKDFYPNGVWGIILEYPYKAPVRLVGEVNGSFVKGGPPESSGLIGFIWEIGNKTFDFGVRKGFSETTPDWEFTTGMTFSF